MTARHSQVVKGVEGQRDLWRMTGHGAGFSRTGPDVFLMENKKSSQGLSRPFPSLCFTETGFWFPSWDPPPLLGFFTYLLSACKQVTVVQESRGALAETSEDAQGLLACSFPPFRSSSTTISSPNMLRKPLLFWLLILPEFNYTVWWTLWLGGWPHMKSDCFRFDVWRKPRWWLQSPYG